jgi:uncharacterized integral membrane protein
VQCAQSLAPHFSGIKLCDAGCRCAADLTFNGCGISLTANRFFFLLMRILFYFSVALAALVALLISAMNPLSVEVELAFLRISAPLGLALVVALVVGLVAGLFWRVYWVAELLNERGRLRRALRLAEAQARATAAAGETAEA